MTNDDDFDYDYAFDLCADSSDVELERDWDALGKIETFFDDHDTAGFPVAIRNIMERKNAEYVRNWKPIISAEMQRRGLANA